VLDRPARKEKDGTDLEETAALELEIVWHRLRRPVGLHLRNRDIAEYRAPVDACLLIGSCQVIENHRAADNSRNTCRNTFLSGVKGIPVRCLDPHRASGLRRWLHLVCRAELQQTRYPLRAHDPPVPLVAQRPGAVPQATLFGYQQFADGAAQHRLHRVAPEFFNRASEPFRLRCGASVRATTLIACRKATN